MQKWGPAGAALLGGHSMLPPTSCVLGHSAIGIGVPPPGAARGIGRGDGGGRVPPPQAELPIPESPLLVFPGQSPRAPPSPAPVSPDRVSGGGGAGRRRWRSAPRCSRGAPLDACTWLSHSSVVCPSVEVCSYPCVSQELKLCTPTVAAGGHGAWARGPPGWVINFISLFFLAQTEPAEGHGR